MAARFEDIHLASRSSIQSTKNCGHSFSSPQRKPSSIFKQYGQGAASGRHPGSVFISVLFAAPVSVSESSDDAGGAARSGSDSGPFTGSGSCQSTQMVRRRLSSRRQRYRQMTSAGIDWRTSRLAAHENIIKVKEISAKHRQLYSLCPKSAIDKLLWMKQESA